MFSPTLPARRTECLARLFVPEGKPELCRLTDEELCRYAQRDCLCSRDLLWQRLQPHVKRIIMSRNRRQRLPSVELADAMQESYFAFHRAVLQYSPETHCLVRPASFRTFLGILVGHSFSSYCQSWRRHESRTAHVSDCEGSQELVLQPNAALSIPCPNDHNGFSETALENFILNDISSEALAAALHALEPKEKLLLENWLRLGRDKDVAEVMGITVVAAKLRRERLFEKVRKAGAKSKMI